MKAVIFGLSLVCSVLPAAATEELTGTPYTLALKVGSAVQFKLNINSRGFNLNQVPERPENQLRGIVRLFDARTKRVIAQADFDERSGGYLFQLPFDNTIEQGKRCLALVNARSQYISVRQPTPNDNGVFFSNPAWDAERSRVLDWAALKAERVLTDAQAANAAKEVVQLQAEIGLPAGSTAADCPTPQEPPPPARPPGAIEAKDAVAMAGPACALRWERDHGSGVQLGRMFADGGVAADWQRRAQVAELLERLPELRIPIAVQDLPLVLDAAAKGKTYLEHSDGVRIFSRAHAACGTEVSRLAAAARDAWATSIVDAREAPQRYRKQCAQKIARIAQLTTAKASAETFLAVLDMRIAQKSEPPRSTEAIALNGQVCQPAP
jgi:hypothetical protein